jgi:hypothetical protein
MRGISGQEQERQIDLAMALRIVVLDTSAPYE